ncbi:short-chain fatty acyl-CoA regulator family protein [Methylopila henanensis]|uniref:Short-chain fatty acyl-CoA regulator family protein n=1 Tax=Methylopila henanensis TaxID=873516 RepID=A0ABW4K857_9HYPH
MRKAFMGVRLKRLREERGMTQVALARALELSPSYLNQLENNQRPLTVPVLLKLNAVFGVDVQLFSEDDEARLISDLRDAVADPAITETVAVSELRELAASMPAVGRALVTLHRRYRQAVDQAEALAAGLLPGGEGAGLAPLTPYEQVRDFFYARHNHFAELDEPAERIAIAFGGALGAAAAGPLAALLEERHGVRVVVGGPDVQDERRRLYRRTGDALHLTVGLRPGQQAFQMATQLAYLELGDVVERLALEASKGDPETHALARIGLAHHFAGAVLMPYAAFLEAAEAARYDVELLAERYGVGFETICHRLSTLQRQNARGVPFVFVRVDRAGNISKRQSATDFHFSRVGGACPLWNVYEAFAQPGRILTQIARMPDGRTYLWIARTVGRSSGGYGAIRKTFAIGLGCDLRHADRLVYSKGLDLSDPDAATPIGAGCKVCERPACPQRAFPPLGRKLAIDEASRTVAPYASG